MDVDRTHIDRDEDGFVSASPACVSLRKVGLKEKLCVDRAQIDREEDGFVCANPIREVDPEGNPFRSLTTYL